MGVLSHFGKRAPKGFPSGRGAARIAGRMRKLISAPRRTAPRAQTPVPAYIRQAQTPRRRAIR